MFYLYWAACNTLITLLGYFTSNTQKAIEVFAP